MVKDWHLVATVDIAGTFHPLWPLCWGTCQLISYLEGLFSNMKPFPSALPLLDLIITLWQMDSKYIYLSINDLLTINIVPKIWYILVESSGNAMAPYSSTLAWKFPWMEEPGRLQSMGWWRVGHDWATSLSLFTFMHWRRKWKPTPVFLPGESKGRGSLVGCSLWGRTESGTTEST